MDTALMQKYLRQFLQFLAGFAAAKGWVGGETASMVAGILASAIIAGWMQYRNTKAARIEDVAAMPEVKTVEVTALHLADRITRPEVKAAPRR